MTAATLLEFSEGAADSRRTMSLYVGDVREGLRKFAADGVRAQTCITSPPYWNLRDYGTAQWDGGDAACGHKGPAKASDKSGLKNDGRALERVGQNEYERGATVPFRDACGKCGARRIDRQIGLEPTPDEYVATMVDVFRLVRDVLADDGTVWLNLGDTYSSGGRETQVRDTFRDAASGKQDYLNGTAVRAATPPGLKPKDLVGIPWRVAFALQADGWVLRSDIIWHKPNPMPESVTDRPTKSHEYVFLLTKSASYYYDAASIAEPSVIGEGAVRNITPRNKGQDDSRNDGDRFGVVNDGTRNRRTVWTIATEPYADAHFATFPTALVEPCVLAGSRVGDTVLDPFMGSGTVAQVAQSLGRRWIGCELNPAYAAMVKGRAAQMGMEFA